MITSSLTFLEISGDLWYKVEFVFASVTGVLKAQCDIYVALNILKMHQTRLVSGIKYIFITKTFLFIINTKIYCQSGLTVTDGATSSRFPAY